MSPCRHSSPFFPLLLFLLLLAHSFQPTSSLGGEKMAYSTPAFAPNVIYRQNVCHRYDLFRSGEIELRYALDGMELRPAMAIGDFFHYDYMDGIDRVDPGLMGTLLDELAERAGFTWRNSFGIQEPPESLNVTWTEMLLWAVDTYDVAINWWDQSVERMEKGVAYIEPWFDGSVILIDQKDPPVSSDKIYLWNWLLPFEPAVWYLIVFTIFASALVFQFLEYVHNERDGRSLRQWFGDSMYLAALNFTQNYEYAPSSPSGRIFGVSMGIWALVITATYTANLASLFVEEQVTPRVVESIDQAVAWDIPICTYGNTNADFILKRKWPDADRKPKISELEAYQSLRAGECELVAGYKDNWLGYQDDIDYNPECDLEWVGRTVEIIKSGFAVKADAGHLCTSLIRDVLNLHLTELISDGVLDDAWDTHRSRNTNQNECVAESDTDSRRLLLGRNGDGQSDAPQKQDRHSRSRRNRRLPQQRQQRPSQRRNLKGASSAAAAAGANASGDSARLTMQQMAGTFFLHFALMTTSIIVALYNAFMKKRRHARRKERGEDDYLRESKMEKKFRSHGPIIGSPPPLNTFVSQRKLDVGGGGGGGGGDGTEDTMDMNHTMNNHTMNTMAGTMEQGGPAGDRAGGDKNTGGGGNGSVSSRRIMAFRGYSGQSSRMIKDGSVKFGRNGGGEDNDYGGDPSGVSFVDPYSRSTYDENGMFRPESAATGSSFSTTTDNGNGHYTEKCHKLFRRLHKDVQTTQKDFVSLQKDFYESRQEMNNQMNLVVGMLRELRKRDGIGGHEE